MAEIDPDVVDADVLAALNGRLRLVKRTQPSPLWRFPLDLCGKCHAAPRSSATTLDGSG